MSEPAHSPLPWRIAQNTWNFRIGIEATGEGLAFESVVAWLTRDGYQLGNANLIVTAVNSHAALLAAAKQAWEAMNAVDCEGNLDAFNSQPFYKAQDSLRAAITKAEELAPLHAQSSFEPTP